MVYIDNSGQLGGMEQFHIQVESGGQIFRYFIVDCVCDDGGYNFEVYDDSRMVACFEPDKSWFLQIAKNIGELSQELIDQIADKIESHYWHWWS